MCNFAPQAGGRGALGSAGDRCLRPGWQGGAGQLFDRPCPMVPAAAESAPPSRSLDLESPCSIAPPSSPCTWAPCSSASPASSASWRWPRRCPSCSAARCSPSVPLAVFARIGEPRAPLSWRRRAWPWPAPALLLGGHWWAFFIAVKVSGVAVAASASPASRPSPCCSKGCCSARRCAGPGWGVVALVSLGLVLVTPNFDLGSDATLGLAGRCSPGCCSPWSR